MLIRVIKKKSNISKGLIDIMKFIKDNFKFIIFFVFIFFIYYILNFHVLNTDPLSNYVFSYAIKRGEIPYLDFNIISTPLYAFFMVPFLFVFDGFITFDVVNSLIVTILFYLLYKMYDKRSYLMIASFLIFSFMGILPTYNFFCIFILVIILYLEKNYNNKDLLIGIFIGLSILSKHTIGCFFIIPSIIYYYKDLKRLFKRFIGLIIPCFIFLIYLIFTKSLFAFIDLCILGLFDFGKSNGNFSINLFLIFSILLFIINIYICIRDKSIINLYVLFSISVVVPLFDYAHFSLYLGVYSIMLFSYLNINSYFYYLMSIFPICCICFLYFIIDLKFDISMYSKGHLKYCFNNRVDYRIELYDYVSSFPNNCLISYFNHDYDLYMGNDVDYFNVFMYGNFGYDGINKMIKNIDNMDNTYFIIDMDNYNDKRSDSQFPKEIADYIFDNYEFVEEKYNFKVYYKE